MNQTLKKGLTQTGMKVSVSEKVQKKFDLVYEKQNLDGENLDELLFSGDDSMGSSSAKNNGTGSGINLDDGPVLDLDSTLADVEVPKDSDSQIMQIKNNKTSASSAAAELEFSLDNDSENNQEVALDATVVNTNAEADILSFKSNNDNTSEGFTLDSVDGLDFEIEKTTVAAKSSSEDKTVVENNEGSDDDFTEKTLLYVDKTKAKAEVDPSEALIDLKFDVTGSHDLNSTTEDKAIIESTIKDIVAPKFEDEKTEELDLTELANPVEEFSVDTPEDAPIENDATVVMDSGSEIFDGVPMKYGPPGTFSNTRVTEAKKVAEIGPAGNTSISSNTVVDRSMTSSRFATENFTVAREIRATDSSYADNTEENIRVQATIRQMREEREELLNQVKLIKGENRELTQDNLTLKSALDEAKIEINILRKRHFNELEDAKSRMGVLEEKKHLAEEKAKLADLKREKLEQKIRIDFNQVKQREKELESKLELLSIDVDAQVQARDQKILELRRKIDALEFNMENASIKEQKSQEDKRKLEDKLSKIMKTLRHSIKNLEEDIEDASEEIDSKKKDNKKDVGKV